MYLLFLLQHIALKVCTLVHNHTQVHFFLNHSLGQNKHTKADIKNE